MLVGLGVGLLLSYAVAAMGDENGNHYYLQIVLPGAVLGLIVGFAARGSASQRREQLESRHADGYRSGVDFIRSRCAVLIDLSGQSVLVTGGSRGIGAAIARQLGASGARVCIHYRSQREAAEALAKDIGHGAFAVGADLADKRACASALGDGAAALRNDSRVGQ